MNILASTYAICVYTVLIHIRHTFNIPRKIIKSLCNDLNKRDSAKD